MRITPEQLERITAGYVLTVEVIGREDPEFYTTGDRQSYAAMLCAHTGRPEVLQVHSQRLAGASVAEDFGTMAGFWWSGDEFALDGRGESEDE